MIFFLNLEAIETRIWYPKIQSMFNWQFYQYHLTHYPYMSELSADLDNADHHSSPVYVIIELHRICLNFTFVKDHIKNAPLLPKLLRDHANHIWLLVIYISCFPFRRKRKCTCTLKGYYIWWPGFLFQRKSIREVFKVRTRCTLFRSVLSWRIIKLLVLMYYHNVCTCHD